MTQPVTVLAHDPNSRPTLEIAESERLQHQIDQMGEEVYRLLVGAVHDIRSEERGVMTSAQLLESILGDSLPPDARALLERLIASSARVSTILAGVSRYAAALHSPGYSFRKVNLTCVVDAATVALEQEIREAGAAISYSGLPEVWGDRDQLVELFRSLLDNAIKYRSASSAKVEIEAQQVTGRKQDDVDFLFSVRDYGMGIGQQHQRSLFCPFRRLHGPEIPGVGLGLLICRKIVEAHGGRLWIESDTGCGLTAFFTLPVPA